MSHICHKIVTTCCTQTCMPKSKQNAINETLDIFTARKTCFAGYFSSFVSFKK